MRREKKIDSFNKIPNKEQRYLTSKQTEEKTRIKGNQFQAKSIWDWLHLWSWKRVQKRVRDGRGRVLGKAREIEEEETEHSKARGVKKRSRHASKRTQAHAACKLSVNKLCTNCFKKKFKAKNKNCCVSGQQEFWVNGSFFFCASSVHIHSLYEVCTLLSSDNQNAPLTFILRVKRNFRQQCWRIGNWAYNYCVYGTSAAKFTIRISRIRNMKCLKD